MKKILMVGVLDKPESTNIHIMRAFQAQGYEVIAYNYRTEYEKADVMGTVSKEEVIQEHLLSTYNINNPDIVFICKGADYLIPALRQIKSKKVLILYWFMDALATARHFIEFVKLSDFVFCTYSSVTHYFRSFNKKTFHIFDGHEPSVFTANFLRKKEYDFFFPGTYTARRNDYIEALRNNKYSVLVTGNGWPKHPDNKPPVYNKEFSNCVHKSRYCLNLLTHPWQAGLSVRFWNMIGSGGNVLSEYCWDYDHVHTSCQMGSFSSISSLLDLVLGFDSNPEYNKGLQAKLENSVKIAKGMYTWNSTVSKIVNILSMPEVIFTSYSYYDRIIIIPFWHGLGDAIMSLPAIQKYLSDYPDVTKIIFLVRNDFHYSSGYSDIFINSLSPRYSVSVLSSFGNPWHHKDGFHVGLQSVLFSALSTISQLELNSKAPTVVSLLWTMMPHNNHKPHKTIRVAQEFGVALNKTELRPQLTTRYDQKFVIDYVEWVSNKKLSDYSGYIVIHSETAVEDKNPPAHVLLTSLSIIKEPKIVLWFGKPFKQDDINLDGITTMTKYDFDRNFNFVFIDYDSIEKTIALVKFADRVISSDSVVFQIAGALGTPVTGIFTKYPASQVIPLWNSNRFTVLEGNKCIK